MASLSNRLGSRRGWPGGRVVDGAAAVVMVVGLCAGVAAAQQSAGKPEVPRTEAPPVSKEFAPPAPNAVADAPDTEKPSYLVGTFVVRYSVEHPQYPALDDINKASVTLGRVDGGFVRPGGGVPTVTYTLEELAAQPAQRYTSAALSEVGAAVYREIAANGLAAVRVKLSEREFAEKIDQVEGEPPFDDLRPSGQTAVTILVGAVVVKEVRSVAFGDKVPFEDRINNPRYDRIVANSPVKPFAPDDEERVDLLRKDKLDDYVYRLNRHPGRRVDLGIEAADDPDALVLDYYVNENKPWLLYFQVSNTGTKQTDLWRERFGFTNNQLTNDDDILNIDYVTAGFDSSNAFNASYDRPVWGDWLRGRLFTSISDFVASDVGVTDQDFSGDSWAVGGELAANVFQEKDWFIDVYGGARWENIHVKGEFGGETTNDTRDDFFLPRFGTRFEHVTDKEATLADLGIEFNLPDVAGTDPEKVAGTGDQSFQRSDADDDWVTFQWDINHSFYLEPLLIPTRWKNLDYQNDPSASPTLAHEIALSLRGQYAFGYRLIPNFEQVAGGMYTVRGYPESIVAGDSIVIGSIEYRFHLPQALGFSDTPGELFGKSFRWKPQGPYGRADWDLVLKGFFDAARTGISSAQAGEEDQTLLGTGVGAELLYRRNFSLRIDWGVALEEIDDPTDGVSSGSNRFHISATILF